MIRDSHFASVDSMVSTLKPSYPVFCLRPKELEKNAKLFLDNFPGRVLYAVKCNPHLDVLKPLYKAGIRHFDTASLTEIATVRENFSDADCYFMHPIKSRAAISSAHKVYRVDHYVIDHESELQKIIDETGGGDGQVVLVRVSTPQHDAAFALSDKFGATPDEAVELLKKVVAEGCQTGLAFHVGSQCRSKEAFKDAIEVVRETLEKAKTYIHYLDVGGGFPVHYVEDQPEPLEEYFQVIKESVATLNLRGDCVLMCEPGRAMVASGASLVVQVQLRKGNQLYINDGIFHSLSEPFHAHTKLPMRVIRRNGEPSKKTNDFTIFGPTCDCTDQFPYTVALPENIDEGDWIEMGQMGAYTNSMSSAFNGFTMDAFVSVDCPPLMPDMVNTKAKLLEKPLKKTEKANAA